MRSRGFALITAVSFALLCFVIASSILALSQFEMRTSSGRSKQARDYFLARGQVHELLARVRAGEDLEAYTQSSPLLHTVDGVKVEAWVEEDPTYPNVYRVRARAGRELSEMIVSRGNSSGGGAYLGLLGGPVIFGEKYPVTFLTQSGIGGWYPIVDPPMVAYNAVKGPVTADYLSKEYQTDDQGRFLVQTISQDNPGIGLHLFTPSLLSNPTAWEDLGPVPKAVDPAAGPPFLDTGQGETEPLTAWSLSRSGAFMYDVLNYPAGEGRGGADGSSVVRCLKVDGGVWSLSDGPPAWEYRADGSLGSRTLDPSSNGWISRLAGRAEEGLVAVVSSADGTGPRNVVASFDGHDWSALPPVPKQYYDTTGTLRSEPGYLWAIDSVAVGPDNEVYAAGDVSGYLTILKLSTQGGGGWAPVKPPLGAPLASFVATRTPPPRLLSVESDGALLAITSLDMTYARLKDAVWTDLPSAPLANGQSPWSCVGGAANPGAATALVRRVSQ